MSVPSVFLKVDPKYRVLENDLVFALYDINPASEGHTLIIPKRQFSSFFEATPDEVVAIYDLLQKTKKVLVEKFNPDGFNIGVNVGEVAGQTVMHAHMHLIPRYKNKSLEKNEHIQKIVHP